MSEAGLQPEQDFDLDDSFENAASLNPQDDLEYWKSVEDEALAKAWEEATDAKKESEDKDGQDGTSVNAVIDQKKHEVQAAFPGHELHQAKTYEYKIEKTADGRWLSHYPGFGVNEWRKGEDGKWISVSEKGEVASETVEDPEMLLRKLEQGQVWIDHEKSKGTVSGIASKRKEGPSTFFDIKAYDFDALSDQEEEGIYESTIDEGYGAIVTDTLHTFEASAEEKTVEAQAVVAASTEESQNQEQKQDFWDSLFNDVPNPLLQVEDVAAQAVQTIETVATTTITVEAVSEVQTQELQSVQSSQTENTVSVTTPTIEAGRSDTKQVSEASQTVKTKEFFPSPYEGEGGRPTGEPGEVSQQSEEAKTQTATAKKTAENKVVVSSNETFEGLVVDNPPTPDSPLSSASPEIVIEQEFIKPEIQQHIQELIHTEPVATTTESVKGIEHVATVFPIELKLNIVIPFQGTVEKQSISEVIASLVDAPVATEVVIVGETNYEQKPMDITIFTKQKNNEIIYEFYALPVAESLDVVNTQWEANAESFEVKAEVAELVLEENEKASLVEDKEDNPFSLNREKEGMRVSGDRGNPAFDKLRLNPLIDKGEGIIPQSNSSEKLVLNLSSTPIDVDDQDTKTPNQRGPLAREKQYEMAA